MYAIHGGKAVIRFKIAYEAKFRQDLKTATDVETNPKTVQSAAPSLESLGNKDSATLTLRRMRRRSKHA